VAEALRGEPADHDYPATAARQADPYGEDLQLALQMCYELHYRGFDSVNPDWEWNPDLLRLRAVMENTFLTALRDGVAGGDDIPGVLDALLAEPVDGTGVSHYLRDEGDWWQACG
jgi:hypothetical protein